MIEQRCKCTKTHQIVHMKMVKMVNFVSIKRRKKEAGGGRMIILKKKGKGRITFKKIELITKIKSQSLARVIK